jgi:hypothetical protein
MYSFLKISTSWLQDFFYYQQNSNLKTVYTIIFPYILSVLMNGSRRSQDK